MANWEDIKISINEIYDKACAVRLSLQLIHEIIPLQDLLESIKDNKLLYKTKKLAFELGFHTLIEKALQLDFHLIKEGWVLAKRLAELTANLFTHCGQNSSVFARVDIGSLLIELAARAVHPRVKATAIFSLSKICCDPFPYKSSFCLKLAPNATLKQFIKLREKGVQTATTTTKMNRPVAIAGLQLIDIICRYGIIHSEIISRFEGKNKRDSIPFLVVDALLFTISSIGSPNSNVLISNAISALMSLCIYCPTNILMLRSLSVDKEVDQVIRSYPFLKEEFSLFIKIMRDDVDMPLEFTKNDAAVLIQKIWRGKCVRVKINKIRIAVKCLQKWIRATLPMLAKARALRRFENNYYINKEQKQLQVAVDRANAEYNAVASVPSNALSLYLKKRANNSASKIQAVWRGYKTRILYAQIRENKKKDLAARAIQQWYKKYKKIKKKANEPYKPPVSPGTFLGRHEKLKHEIKARPPNSPVSGQVKLVSLLAKYPKQKARQQVKVEHINYLLNETNKSYQFLIGTNGSIELLEKKLAPTLPSVSSVSSFHPPAPPPFSNREKVAHSLHQKELLLAEQPWWKKVEKPNWELLN